MPIWEIDMWYILILHGRVLPIVSINIVYTETRRSQGDNGDELRNIIFMILGHCTIRVLINYYLLLVNK